MAHRVCLLNEFHNKIEYSDIYVFVYIMCAMYTHAYIYRYYLSFGVRNLVLYFSFVFIDQNPNQIRVKRIMSFMVPYTFRKYFKLFTYKITLIA